MRRCAALGLPLAAFLALAACEGGGAGPNLASEWEPLDSSGPLAMRFEELWRRDVSDWVDSFGGVGVWGNGTIWIGERRSERIWELNAGSGSVRLVRDDGDAAERPGGTLGMAFAPGHGMYILSRNGVTVVPARGSAAAFSEAHRGEAWGFAPLADGDYVVAHGQYPDDPHVDYALHRYGAGGDHVASWHPAFEEEDWVRVMKFSGGPIAATAGGDLLLSELAPFRIVKYLNAMGDSAVVVAEDEGVVSAAEFDRAMPEPGFIEFQWSHSIYIDELPDGRILNVVEAYPGGRRDPEMRWMVLSSDGEILARTSFGDFHRIAARAGPGAYLVHRDGTIGEVRVSVAAGQ